jgi:hypothetical protein
MSTVPRPGRRNVQVRLSWAAVDMIEEVARDEGVVDDGGGPNRSEMIRIMLAYAARHRPRGWRP